MRPPVQLAWADLAAHDDRTAADFYAALFDWTARDEQVGHGRLTRFFGDGRPVATLYRLDARQREGGVPAHWTCYFAVDDVAARAARARALGGAVLVGPTTSAGERLALCADRDGALFGLLER